jgi:hypothetical protein
VNELQSIADALGLPLNGVYSASARAKRAALDGPALAPRAAVPSTAPAKPAPRPPSGFGLLPIPPVALRAFDWHESVHEAGHCAAALAFGLDVSRVSVASRAACWFGAPLSAHTEAVILFAGPLAEKLFAVSACPFGPLGTGGSDLRNVAALGLSEAEERAARAEAERLVKANRDRIGRIATALVQRGELDGPEARRLFIAPH